MNKASTKGFKLTTVLFAVIVLALSAIFSSTSMAASDMDVQFNQLN